MKKQFPIIFTIFFFIACKHDHTVDDIHLSNTDPLTLKIDEYFEALTQLGKFNGVIAISKDQKLIHLKAYNSSHDKNSSLRVNQNSQFDIHSISKIMAHYLILKMDQNGKLSINDPISKYYPEFPNGDNITIDMLIKHQSGLPREFESFSGKKIELSKHQLVELIKKEQSIFPPGEQVQYSNLGYQLLYSIFDEINGQSFEQYLIDELFSPLKMKASGSHFYSNASTPKNLAANHEMTEDTFERVDNILEDEFKQARIYSCAKDLITLLDNFQNDTLSNGMAKKDIIAHSGGSDGIRAHVQTNLDDKISFVLLCNFDAIPFNQAIEDMTKMVENKPYEVPKALNRKSVDVSTEILNKYKGTYTFPDMQKLVLLIDVKDGQLMVQQVGDDPSILYAENDSVFFPDPEAPESFEFISNENVEFDMLMGFRGVKLPGHRLKTE